MAPRRAGDGRLEVEVTHKDGKVYVHRLVGDVHKADLTAMLDRLT